MPAARRFPPPWSVEEADVGGRVSPVVGEGTGSTGIAARLDAEEWRDLVGGYLDAASAAVTEMGVSRTRCCSECDLQHNRKKRRCVPGVTLPVPRLMVILFVAAGGPR
jgi:hypothetical protein